MNKKNILLFLCFMLAVCLGGCSLHKVRKTSEVLPYEPCDKEQPQEQQEICVQLPMGRMIEGESFFYEVHWLGLNVGQASLRVSGKTEIEGRQAYHIILSAQTSKFFSIFFKVKGTVESFVDADTYRPIIYSSETIIHKKNVFKKMRYDFNSHIVYAEDKKGKYEVEITDETLDPLGIFYYFRLNKVAFNESINLIVNGGKKNFPITVYVDKIRKISLPAGSFTAFMVAPTTQSERQFDDSLNAPGSMLMWFSMDDKRIPLLITLKVPLGTAQAVLIKAEIPGCELTDNTDYDKITQSMIFEGEHFQ